MPEQNTGCWIYSADWVTLGQLLKKSIVQNRSAFLLDGDAKERF